MRVTDFLADISRETRVAARSLGRSPAFSLVALLTLILGIGSATAIYTVLDAVALHPLPYPRADRLLSVMHRVRAPGTGEATWGLSVAGYFYFRSANHTLDDLGVYLTNSAVVTSASGAEEVRTAQISAPVFSILGAHSVLGRLIGSADDRPGAPLEVVLSYEYWRRHFGANPAVLGHSLRIGNVIATIIGVTAPGFTLPRPGAFASTTDLASFGVDICLPLQLDPTDKQDNSHAYAGLARLRPGVSVAAAQSDLSALVTQMPARLPDAYTSRFLQEYDLRIAAVRLRDAVVGPKLTRILWLTFGAVLVVLVIAGVNVTNLFLVRWVAKRREAAIRRALGASQGRMVIHALSESLVLTLIGGILGLVVAALALPIVLRLAPTDIPRLSSVRLSATSGAFSALLSIMLGLAFGAISIRGRRGDEGAIRGGERTVSASKQERMAQKALLVGQIALAFVLLTASGLILRSVVNLRAVRPGLDPRSVLTFEIVLPNWELTNAEQAAAFNQELQTRLSAVPGVERVGASTMLPFRDYGSGCTGVGPEPQYVRDTGEEPPCVSTPSVTPGFFEALGIQVRGRTPTWDDVDPFRRHATVAVVTAALASRLWPGEDAVGKGIFVGNRSRGYYRVIGVIPEIRAHGLDQSPSEAVMIPEPEWYENLVIKVKSGDPLAFMPTLRRTIVDMSPNIAIANPQLMTTVVARSMARTSFVAVLLTIAGAMALLLSAVGIYGVISYTVAQRRAEIGMRMALGAGSRRVAMLVVGQSIRLALAGITIGVIASVAVTGVMRAVLFEISPTDATVLVGSALILAISSLVASLVPTRRATAIDPISALRGP